MMPITNGGLIVRLNSSINYDQFVRHFYQQFLLNLDSCDTISPNNKYVNLHCDLVTFCGYLFKRIVSKHGTINVRDHFSYKHSLEGEDLNVYLATWFQTPFEKNKPLWNGVIISVEASDKSNLENSTVVAFKASHALVDGYSLVHMLEKMTTCCDAKQGVVLGRQREEQANKKKDINTYESIWNEV